MVIEPRRRRRGRVGRGSEPWKYLSVATLSVAIQCLPQSAAAQVPLSGNGSATDPLQNGIPAGGGQGVQAAGNAGAPRDPWRFVPSIGVDETWSDNINLAPKGSAQSDFVTSINPALRLTRYGPSLTAIINYSPQFLLYARGTNGSQLRNYLDATINAAIVENFLFFDALASVSQANISPFGAQSADSINGSQNRAETRNFSFGPTLRSHVGSDLTYSAGYHYTLSTSDSSAYSNSHSSILFGRFESGTSFRNLGYGADASRSEQSFGNAGEIVQETIGTTLTYVVTPTFHLRGRLGYDRNSYPTTGQPDLKGASYSGGFDYQPSHHTSLNVQVGHRYFGPTANISLNETTGKVAIRALYSRDQTTTSGAGLTLSTSPTYALLDQFLRSTITDPALRATAVVNALQQAGLPTSQFATTSFLSNQLFLQKLAQVSVVLLGLRNTVSFDASRNESQSLSNIDTGIDVFDQAQRFRSTSISVNWSHRLGPNTNTNATLSKIHSQAVGGGSGDTQQWSLTASINRQFLRRLSGTLLVRHVNQSGNNQNNNNQNTGASAFGSNFFSGSYRENAVLGSLRLTF